MNWIKCALHHCGPPGNIFAPVYGQEIACLICGTVWVYESRIVVFETRPAVWDQWAQTDTETITRWWKKD